MIEGVWESDKHVEADENYKKNGTEFDEKKSSGRFELPNTHAKGRHSTTVPLCHI